MVSSIQSTSNVVLDKKNQVANNYSQPAKVADYPDDKFEKQNQTESKSEKQSELSVLDLSLMGIAGVSATFAAFKTHQVGTLKNQVEVFKKSTASMSEFLGNILKSVGKEVPETATERLKSVSKVITVDDMTGLFNKASLKTSIPIDYQEAIKKGESFTVGMLDMDNFKGINEVFDHKTGDKFIKRIAANISEVTQKYGAKGYRYGGEEFVVAIKGQDAQTSNKMLEEISDLIRNDKEIQGYLPKFKEDAKKELDFITPHLEKLDGENQSNIFLKLRQVSNLNVAEQKQLKNELTDIISKFVEKYKPANSKDLTEVVTKINSDSSKLSDVLNLKTKVGESSNLGKELDKIYNQYKGHKPELDKWLRHVDTHNMFTVSGGFINLDKELVKSDDAMALVSIADGALGSAKNMGKNTIVVADDAIQKAIDAYMKAAKDQN